MHPCLRIEEIETLIFSYLRKEDLYSVALTCRLLKDPALNTLWRELDTVYHLLTLFPNDSWKTQPGASFYCGGHLLEVIEPTRPLLPKDWTSVTPYALSVRRLSVDEFDMALSRPFIYPLLHALNGAPMFPNLRELRLSFLIDPYISFVNAVLSPSLTHLALRSSFSQGALKLLSGLGTLCPSMISFTCPLPRNRNNAVILADAISESVICWNKIKRLEVPVLRTDALQHLSCLPQFTHLSMFCDFGQELIPDPEAFAGFDSLRSFKINRCPLETVTQILVSMGTRVLNSMTLQLLREREPLEDWENYLSVLAKRTPLATALDLTTLGRASNEDGLLRKGIFQPFLAAHNIIHLSFTSCPHFNFTDDSIMELAKASPNLRTIDFGSDTTLVMAPTLTLNAYRHLFKHCPELEKLGLVIDTDTNKVAEEFDNGRVNQYGRNLQLYVGNSAVKDSYKLAAFLLPYFYEPMGYIQAGFTTSTVVKGWREVRNTLAELIQERTKETSARL